MFLVTPDHRVELAGLRRLGEIARIFLQRVIALLGGRGVGRAALADGVDRLVQPLRRDAGGLQRLGGFGLFDGKGLQQALGGDIAVAGLLTDLLRGVEDAGEFGREIDLARAGARNLRHFFERRFFFAKRKPRVAACCVDEAGGKALLVIEQHFQKVFRREALVALTQRQRLGGLDEATRTLGVFLEIHKSSPPRHISEAQAGRFRNAVTG